MLIHNTTFMMLREREEEFLRWFRAELPALTGTDAGAAPRLSAMRTAGGVSHSEAEAQSVAFQMEFADRNRLDKWARNSLADVAARFEERFGPDAVVFTSVFETLPL